MTINLDHLDEPSREQLRDAVQSLVDADRYTHHVREQRVDELCEDYEIDYGDDIGDLIVALDVEPDPELHFSEDTRYDVDYEKDLDRGYDR